MKDSAPPCSCPLSCRWSSGWGVEACPSPPGLGAGDTLWLQFSPPAASAAPCWQTDHSGAGPTNSRAGRGSHPGGWIQTLPGTPREHHTLLHLNKKLNLSEGVWPLFPHSSRCWHLPQLKPSQLCVHLLSSVQGPVRGSVWFWWTTTHSSTSQTCWLWRERTSSVPPAAPSSWSTETREMWEKSWVTSERGQTATASGLSFNTWRRSSTKRKEQRWTGDSRS